MTTETTTKAPENAEAEKLAADRERSAALSISAHEARELGENAVKRGALERAEANVASSMVPPAPQKVTTIWVQNGKVFDTPPEGGSVQLTGAQADAYKAAHGGAKAEATAKAEAKPAAKPTAAAGATAKKAATKAAKKTAKKTAKKR
jgi:hypothetical protein